MVPHLFHDPVWTRKSGWEAIWKSIAVEQIEKVVPLSTDCSRPPLTFQMIKLKCFDRRNSQEDVMMNRYWWKTGWQPSEIGNIWKTVYLLVHIILPKIWFLELPRAIFLLRPVFWLTAGKMIAYTRKLLLAQACLARQSCPPEKSTKRMHV